MNWAGGGKVKLALGPPGDAARGAALLQLEEMTEADFVKNVLHLRFLGQSEDFPITLRSTLAVRRVVQTNPNTIGILRIADANASVKIMEFAE